ncbi:aldehyde dehydrogenase 7 family [Thecamonas trahens ATCC 50062]|uniref:aldehyde dehydrogenase (NAD(+)) n=1 Tax=Thecamonas trahens ATCC 50062 TaxID=461836 RepID=A0A0L0DNJ5_THETB|nr:aldehyde dehydrogenase 7 family [Thecamonas trahens ATCC 50062]KNC53561.1 aldehyde dehydrogenase 7 family [Thecamonas trahens ATCC 50062]|eukprot:XP_013761880.1 aldehyde dehydrogenase 7 family [Thecamonas trahens ATCC 50062]
MAADERIKLMSFTGSTAVGLEVGKVVQSRFGRSILELGGNAAVVVEADANLDLALQAVFFGSVGTAGQRCTSTRRLLLHEDIHDEFLERLTKLYAQVRMGDPLEDGILYGPLHTKAAVEQFKAGVAEIKAQGGEILVGGDIVTHESNGNETRGNFVAPTITAMSADSPLLQDELFLPILHTVKYSNLDEAIAINNSVPQGLASALFTTSIGSMARWTGPYGSDCGIVNVNTSSSGAEIGGAFQANKASGDSSESGSDTWKQYMRRGTATINTSNDMPLSQGIEFN